MITLFRSSTIFSHQDAREFMAKQLGQLISKVKVIGTLTTVLRFELPCEPLDLLGWLNSQKDNHKFYWSNREGDFEMAGFGAADCIQGNEDVNFQHIFEHMKERLSERNPHLRYYGGIGFKGNFYFFIPRFEILRSGDEWLFAVNIRIEDIEESKIRKILEELSGLTFVLVSETESFQHVIKYARSAYFIDQLPSKIPSVTQKQNLPERKEWDKIFTEVQRGIENKDFEKIVLARKTTYEFAQAPNPWVLLNDLKEKTARCFHFCLMPDGNTTFLGASPERLYRREGRDIETEALAGTKSKGQNKEEDKKRREVLLSSLKDNQEHLFVVKFINDILQNICVCVNQDKKPNLFEQNAGYHLITQFKGTLHPQVDDASILSQLHPTPAVSGYPKQDALRCIQELESFERGWYAGALGFAGYDEVEFCVAIRSGLIQDKKLSLYAGAGIVAQSTAQGEWEEIEAKIRSFGI